MELATLTWVEWYNNRRLLESIGNIPGGMIRIDEPQRYPRRLIYFVSQRITISQHMILSYLGDGCLCGSATICCEAYGNAQATGEIA